MSTTFISNPRIFLKWFQITWWNTITDHNIFLRRWRSERSFPSSSIRKLPLKLRTRALELTWFRIISGIGWRGQFLLLCLSSIYTGQRPYLMILLVLWFRVTDQIAVNIHIDWNLKLLMLSYIRLPIASNILSRWIGSRLLWNWPLGRLFELWLGVLVWLEGMWFRGTLK
jgi:hypothetical protein